MKKYLFVFNGEQLRLDIYLSYKIPEFSRSKIKNFIKSGNVKINGQVTKPSIILQGNEFIECDFNIICDNKNIEPQKMDLDIIYEDSSFAVINKPAGLVVHPGSGNKKGTLLNGLVYHFNKLSYKNTERPGIVHRLDKDTSGLIIIAKNDLSHDRLSQQFSKKEIKKIYYALVWGEIKKSGKISGMIGRHLKNRKLFTIVSNNGRESLTQYIVDSYLPPLSWVKLYPKTGRTHQLRVHLKSIGHPILCDEAYGGGVKNIKSFHVKYVNLLNNLMKKINRVALHAYQLEFMHPESQEKMKFNSPIPNDISNALEILNRE